MRMDANYLITVAVSLVILLAVTLVYRYQTPRKERHFLASLLEAVGVLGGAVAGGVLVGPGGFLGFLMRVGVLAAIALPFLLLGAYLRRNRNRAAL